MSTQFFKPAIKVSGIAFILQARYCFICSLARSLPYNTASGYVASDGTAACTLDRSGKNDMYRYKNRGVYVCGPVGLHGC